MNRWDSLEHSLQIGFDNYDYARQLELHEKQKAMLAQKGKGGASTTVTNDAELIRNFDDSS